MNGKVHFQKVEVIFSRSGYLFSKISVSLFRLRRYFLRFRWHLFITILIFWTLTFERLRTPTSYQNQEFFARTFIFSTTFHSSFTEVFLKIFSTHFFFGALNQPFPLQKPHPLPKDQPHTLSQTLQQNKYIHPNPLTHPPLKILCNPCIKNI